MRAPALLRLLFATLPRLLLAALFRLLLAARLSSFVARSVWGVTSSAMLAARLSSFVARSVWSATCSALLLAAMCFPVTAKAESGATLVAIVTAEPSATLTRRVRAELLRLGVDVLVIKPPDEASPARSPLEQAARGVGAAAAIRLVASTEGKIEVWVADRVTGKTVVRELESPGTNASDATVALGAVELLRASLMEIHSPDPPRGEVATTPKIAALALPVRGGAPSLPRLGLSIGAGAELGVRGLGPSADARIALSARLWDRLFLRAIGDVTLAPASVDTPAGAVESRALWFGGSLVYQLTDPSSAWAPELSLGLAAAHVTATGHAQAPLIAASEGTWVAAPFAGLGLGYTLIRGIRIRADALVAWAAPGVRVRTPAGEAGLWGAPALMLAPGIELLWSP